MPSPDLRPYVDLTILDVTPDELAAVSIDVLAARLPGWSPAEADVEVTLLEANAVITSQLVYAVNRLPGAILETLLRLFGATRAAGIAATADITVTVPDVLGHTIPAGTRFLLNAGPTIDTITLALTADIVIAPGANTGTGPAAATVPSPDGNGVAAGTAVVCVDAVPMRGAVLASDLGGGALAEDGVAFLARSREILARLTDTLVLPAHFTAAALDDPAVYRATTLDRYDADTDTANVNGHVTVAVAGRTGTLLSDPAKTALAATLAAQALSSLTVHVIDATINSIDVTAAVVTLPGYDQATVHAAVTAAITAYLNPDTWTWAGTVRKNELIAVASDVLGVDYVAGVSLDDTTLTGPAPLAAAGTIVTVED